MAKLPDNITVEKTVLKMFDYFRDNNKDWRRSHLGASVIGRECERQIWYSFRWAVAPDFPNETLALFYRGNEEEAVFTRRLRHIGVDVCDIDPETGKQLRVTPQHDGHFGGSLDGVGIGFAEAPKTYHLIEYKTANKKSFEDLYSKGVQDSKPEHYTQMQVYMYLEGLTRAYYFSVCKDNDRIHGERIKLDKKHAIDALEKARRIIFSDNPPPRVSDNPTWYKCKWCDDYKLCHFQSVAEVSCRTCAHSTPGKDSLWDCAWTGKTLDDVAQKKACEHHLFNPAFVTIGKPVDAGQNWIKYDDGTINTTSPDDANEYTSLQLLKAFK